MHNYFECSSCGKRVFEINRAVRLKVSSEQKTLLFCSSECCGVPILIFFSSLSQEERLSFKEIQIYIFNPEETFCGKPIIQPFPNGEVLYQGLLRAEELCKSTNIDAFLSIKADLMEPEFIEAAKRLKEHILTLGLTEEDQERLKAYLFKYMEVTGGAEPRPYKP